MTREENIRAIRRWFSEGWEGNLDLAEEIFSPALTTNGVAVGIEGPKRNNRNRLAGFPDVHAVIEDIIEAGDRFVIRLVWQGTHTGPYSGVSATRRVVRVRGLAIWRFASGKVVEIWSIQDQFSLLRQIGVVSPEIGGVQAPVEPEGVPGGPPRDA